MSTAITFLPVGCLVFVAAAMTLVSAVLNAEEGYEDDSGFHRGVPT